eukprot:TRINITY_DN19331_c0_g1_i1.p2 TRINITY_DN19331_c0_g1~~TRINITY_DN19331_c0_g1_i1.p2  ORF type:complete len:296 (-),score=120.69 TRINITY_DN19331_c0_g1_i1:73-960(-)
MSQIGPMLPPHLAKKRQEDSDSDSSDDGYAPQLPSVACRGPAPSVGPAMAPSGAGDDTSSDSDDGYGPALPPQFRQNSDVGRVVEIRQKDDESDSDSDGEVIGPTMQEKTGELSREDIAREFEMRSKKMKDRLEGKDVKEVQRESWMLELPEEKANSFGLGARQFSRKGLPEKGKDRSKWTDSPAEKERKIREGVTEEEAPEEAPMVNIRDVEMEKVAQELRQKRGADTLMDMHEKKMQKKKKEDIASGEVGERRPFDRDIDLQANRFDDAVKKNMLKSAALINDRFSSGNQKFL